MDVASEAIIDPELPIVDPHHHVWYQPDAVLDALDKLPGEDGAKVARCYRLHRRYLFDELLADINTGHNIVATVFVEAHTMYRPTLPDGMKSLGEIEFVTGIAAMSASGMFGPARLCAGIVGGVDLRLGDGTGAVLDAHIQAAGGRYRGIRPQSVSHDGELTELKGVLGQPGLLLDAEFRKGVAHVRDRGLTLDIYVMDNQLPEVLDLARAFPDVQMILDHTGGPVGIGPYVGRHEERFASWRQGMADLAQCPNVAVKVGGLGMSLCGFATSALVERPGSERLARDWRPHVETAIELFGAQRCMFESNFPVDGVTAAYPVIWNTFKRITSGASADEKAALFAGTAARIYSVEI